MTAIFAICFVVMVLSRISRLEKRLPEQSFHQPSHLSYSPPVALPAREPDLPVPPMPPTPPG